MEDTSRRTVFFISDGTGITAETLGHSLITQFEEVEFETVTIPYVDTEEKATELIQRINQSYQENGHRPLIFATFVDPQIHKMIATSEGKLMDFFRTYIEPLEKELQLKSSFTIGRSHAMLNFESYKDRIDAINYTLTHDDGLHPQNYKKADVILIGVSRSGKTPTCLYLALQFGILAANYPFTSDDFNDDFCLPQVLRGNKDKLFGLTIDVNRLRSIRSERFPNSDYASLRQCKKETNEIVAMYNHEGISFINTTYSSIEEIATKILAHSGIHRRTF